MGPSSFAYKNLFPCHQHRSFWSQFPFRVNNTLTIVQNHVFNLIGVIKLPFNDNLIYCRYVLFQFKKLYLIHQTSYIYNNVNIVPIWKQQTQSTKPIKVSLDVSPKNATWPWSKETNNPLFGSEVGGGGYMEY